MTGTLTASYDDPTGKVTLVAGSTPAGTVTETFERSVDQITWTAVRGGQAVISNPTTTFLDYEYVPGVPNFYRVTFNGSTGTHTIVTASAITPNQTGCFLKNPLRPFLNRRVTVIDFDDLTRESRSGVFNVIGRTLPVAVTDLMSGRSTSITMRTTTSTDADDIEFLVAVGEVLLVQPPGGSAVPMLYAVPTGLARSRVAQSSAVRRITVPLTESVVPDLTLAAVQSTWTTVVNQYASWSALTTAKASWTAVLQLVGTAADVITS